jgi:hypothetical protein
MLLGLLGAGVDLELGLRPVDVDSQQGVRRSGLVREPAVRRLAQAFMLTQSAILPLYDAASAQQLAHAPYFRRRHAGRIVVAVKNVPEPLQRLIEARLNRLYNACGCTSGAWALCLGLLGWAVTWMGMARFPNDAITMIPAGIGVAILTGGFGKVLGLLLARRALREELFRLAAVACGTAGSVGAVTSDALANRKCPYENVPIARGIFDGQTSGRV